jgi:hypothetical protein
MATGDEVQFNAAFAALAGPGTVRASVGDFNLVSPIVIQLDWQNLAGNGWGTNFRPAANVASIINVGGGADSLVEGTILKNFSINGMKASYTVGHGIYHIGVTRPLTYNIYLYDISGNGLTVGADGTHSSYVPRYKDCWILNVDGSGILLDSGGTIEGAKIDGNNLEGCGQNALFLRGSYHTISGNKINNTGILGTFKAAIVNYATRSEFIGGEVLVSQGHAFYNGLGGSTIVTGVHFTDASTAANDTYYWFVSYNASGEGLVVTGCTFDYDSANKPKYVVWSRGGSCTRFNNNIFKPGAWVTAFEAPIGVAEPIGGELSNSLAQGINNNLGYIHQGELRTASGALTAGNANAFAIAWNNPESQAIWAQLMVEITTAGGTAGALLDAGSAANATTTSDNLIDGADLNATNLLVSSAWVKLDANGGATDWITGQILVANAASLAGKFYVKYIGV